MTSRAGVAVRRGESLIDGGPSPDIAMFVEIVLGLRLRNQELFYFDNWGPFEY